MGEGKEHKAQGMWDGLGSLATPTHKKKAIYIGKYMVVKVVQACNPSSTWKARVGGSWVQDQSGQDHISKDKHNKTKTEKRTQSDYYILDVHNEVTADT